MTTIVQRSMVLALFSAVSAWAGALTIMVSSPDGNAEARSLQAAVVAEVTACHEPSKTKVTAFLVRDRDGVMQRVALEVVPLKKAGSYAILGRVPPSSVIDLTVSNPEYRDYRPHVLIRSDAHGLQWGLAKRFYSVAPTDADLRALL